MNRGRRIKQIRRQLLKQGYINHEHKCQPNKDFPPYRKGSYNISYIDERNDISFCLGDSNKYLAYKELLKEIMQENTRRAHGKLNLLRLQHMPIERLQEILAPYPIPVTTDFHELRNRLFDYMEIRCRTALEQIQARTYLDDFDLEACLESVISNLNRHPFAELICYTVNTGSDDQPLVTGTFYTAVPKDLQELQNLCWGW